MLAPVALDWLICNVTWYNQNLYCHRIWLWINLLKIFLFKYWREKFDSIISVAISIRPGQGDVHLEGWDMLCNIHFMLCTTFVTQQNNAAYTTCYIPCQWEGHITIKHVTYTIYNDKTCYIYNLQLIYTFEYNTLYKKIKTCYVTKVVCNMYKLLYTLLHDMLYSCLENQCNT